MVVYILWIQADLEGVSRMILQDSADLCVTVRNPLDHSQVRERIVIDPSALEDAAPSSTAHHHAKHAPTPCHLSLKWTPDATERATIRVWNTKNADELFAKHHKKNQTARLTTQYTADDSGKRVPVLALECEGHVEPIKWHLMGHEFVVTTMAGQQHGNLDWNDTDTWTAYDLASGSTTIANFKAFFE